MEELRGAAVELSAILSETPPRVTLRWPPGHFPVVAISLQRRVVGTPDWEPAVSLPANATSYADLAASSGTLYEYRVTRSQDSAKTPVAEGRIWSGMELPPIDERGRLILVVDETMAVPLATEIDRLAGDLVGDGWRVARVVVARTAAPAPVKDAILAWHAEEPESARAVLLFGRIAVPYSGAVCPDGHYDEPPLPHHRGAWPADAYYGDVDGAWTDDLVDYRAGNVDGTRNHNVPGDGKFDVSLLTGANLPELAVGRIDLANLDGVANGATEANLLRRYLDRHHAFRHRLPPFETLGERALVDDDTFGPEWGESFAAGGWASGVALFGDANTSAGDWVPGLQARDHLLAFGCGPGSAQGALGVSTIADFRDTPCRAVFNLLFGSFFGDWDAADNYLRAPLAARADSHGLVSLWAGNPRWQLFPLAAGGTLADAYRHTVFEINQPDGPFPPSDESWTNPDQVHVAVLGDPVLRLHPVKPVSNLAATAAGNRVTLAWSLPSGEPNLVGCRIFRSTGASGPYAFAGIAGPGETSFLDTVPGGGTWHYLVRAVKRQTTASAVYDNPAQGVGAEVEVAPFGYEAWSEGLEQPGEMADANGDGVPNLLAYALGAEDGNAPATRLAPESGGGNAFTVPFSDRPDLAYRVELSADLLSWHAVATRSAEGGWTLNPDSGYSGQGNLTIQGGSPIVFRDGTEAPRRFWRLAVIR